jgi:two-component system response regulator WspF
LLRRLPADLPAAVLIAQHVDQEYAGGLARWLGQFARLPVQLASAGSVPQAGRVYLAASDQHMIVAADRTLRYTADPAGWYRPSVDALFESAARHWPWPGVAALLTGMGGDGAAGLAALKQAGWMTIAQDCGSSVVWGMPKAAIELGAAQKVLATSEIGSAIVSAFSLQTSAATAKRG